MFLKKKSIPIKDVLEDSIAKELGIVKEDKLLSINGNEIKDIFEYRFLITNPEIVLKIQKEDGEVWEIEIEKEEYEDLGIEFEDLILDREKSCRNNCIFCFIDQMPRGMRETLYFKDDDTRLSFYSGNYVTLTNVNHNDIERIIKYKMSPINVSVHSTNPDLRVFMLNNKTAGDVLSKIKMLIDGGIEINCQIVLCREINDKTELDRTINELGNLYPVLNSISIVPVGITKYRDNLYQLKSYDKKSSIEVIKQVENWQIEFMKKYGSRIVYLADEFYIMANFHMPPYESYEHFPQIENGVGLISLMLNEFYAYLKEINITIKKARKISIATGVSPYNYIKKMTDILENKYSNLDINVYKIKNDFFGENVTVTGLITAKDLINQLLGKELGEELLISRSMLRTGEDVFLDDCTLEMLESKLEVKVTVVENNGRDFIDKILGV